MASTNPSLNHSKTHADDEATRAATANESKTTEPTEPDQNSYDPNQEAKPYYTDKEGKIHERPKLSAFRKLQGIFDGGTFWEEMADYIEKSEDVTEQISSEKATDIAIKEIKKQVMTEQEKLNEQVKKIQGWMNRVMQKMGDTPFDKDAVRKQLVQLVDQSDNIFESFLEELADKTSATEVAPEKIEETKHPSIETDHEQALYEKVAPIMKYVDTFNEMAERQGAAAKPQAEKLYVEFMEKLKKDTYKKDLDTLSTDENDSLSVKIFNIRKKTDVVWGKGWMEEALKKDQENGPSTNATEEIGTQLQEAEQETNQQIPSSSADIIREDREETPQNQEQGIAPADKTRKIKITTKKTIKKSGIAARKKLIQQQKAEEKQRVAEAKAALNSIQEKAKKGQGDRANRLKNMQEAGKQQAKESTKKMKANAKESTKASKKRIKDLKAKRNTKEEEK